MSNYGSVEMDLKGKIILTYLLTSCKVTKATCLAYVQVNEYETDPNFLHRIKPSFDIILFQDFKRFAGNLQHTLSPKLFLLLFLNNFGNGHT